MTDNPVLAPKDLLPAVDRRGLMLVLSSPSGAGKTTIARALVAAEPALAMSISATTRAQRPGETEGVDYHFVDAERFAAMADGGELLEHALVYGNRYGTPRGPVEEALRGGRDVLFDIDWQGAQQLRSAAPEDVVSLFILPPSVDELKRRLQTRARDTDEEVARRLAKVADDVTHWPEYDYVVVNEDRDRSLAQVQSILVAARLKRARQTGLFRFVERFRSS